MILKVIPEKHIATGKEHEDMHDHNSHHFLLHFSQQISMVTSEWLLIEDLNIEIMLAIFNISIADTFV